MNIRYSNVLSAIRLLNPADNAALFKGLWIRQRNSESLYVVSVIIEGGVLYGKSDRGDSWHMMPADEVVGFEVETKKNPWFSDAPTLPAIIAKLQLAEKRADAA